MFDRPSYYENIEIYEYWLRLSRQQSSDFNDVPVPAGVEYKCINPFSCKNRTNLDVSDEASFNTPISSLNCSTNIYWYLLGRLVFSKHVLCQ